MEIAEFLLAWIAEDEAVARDAFAEDFGDYFTPARVLAECEAKRRIVELHEMITVDYKGEWWTQSDQPPGTYVRTGCGNCTGCGVDGEEYINDGPCDTLRLLALPYADHADYRDEWKP